jgi:hypothetical protein
MPQVIGTTRIVVNEVETAKAIDMSVHFLRKDRRTKRLIPFYRIGDCIRYNLDRVRESLAALEEGGAHIRRGGHTKKSGPADDGEGKP